jgi:SAM-dependent methyltransferase
VSGSPPTAWPAACAATSAEPAVESRSGEVRAAYDTIAEAYAAAFPGTEPEAALDLAVLDDFTRRVLEAGGSTRVLDAGCGTGRIARRLSDRGCVVTGVDLSPGMLAVARRDHPDLDLAEGSLTDLPFDDGVFDGVLCWYSLIHLTDDELPVALAEVARVLRPGGVVLVGFQKGDGVSDVGERLRERGHDVALVRFERGPKTMLDALAAAGFVKEARLVREPIGAERQGQAFVLARLPAAEAVAPSGRG